MTVSGFWPIFSLGLLGGLLVELLRWWKLRESANFPNYVRSPFYWGLTAAMVLAGGLITVLYGLGEMTAVLPVNIGASAPALISAMASGPVRNSFGITAPSAKGFLSCNCPK